MLVKKKPEKLSVKIGTFGFLGSHCLAFSLITVVGAFGHFGPGNPAPCPESHSPPQCQLLFRQRLHVTVMLGEAYLECREHRRAEAMLKDALQIKKHLSKTKSTSKEVAMVREDNCHVVRRSSSFSGHKMTVANRFPSNWSEIYFSLIVGHYQEITFLSSLAEPRGEGLLGRGDQVQAAPLLPGPAAAVLRH